MTGSPTRKMNLYKGQAQGTFTGKRTNSSSDLLLEKDQKPTCKSKSYEEAKVQRYGYK